MHKGKKNRHRAHSHTYDSMRLENLGAFEAAAHLVRTYLSNGGAFVRLRLGRLELGLELVSCLP